MTVALATTLLAVAPAIAAARDAASLHQGPVERAKRSAFAAALFAALALPALVAASMAAPAAAGTIPLGAFLVFLAAYALLRAAAVVGRWYPAVATLWLGLPPLCHFILMDVLGRRADRLLALGPASGAAWVVRGVGSAGGGVPGRFVTTGLILALAGIALSVLPGHVRRRAGRENDTRSA